MNHLATSSGWLLRRLRSVLKPLVVSRSYKSEAAAIHEKSYYHRVGSLPLPSYTLGDVIDMAAEDTPDNDALIIPFQDIRKSFLQIKEDVDRFASGLIQLGFTRGDRICIYAPNLYEWVVTEFATAKIGVVLVLINPALQKAEVDHLLQLVDCHGVIFADMLGTTSLYNTICDLLPEVKRSTSGALNSSKYPNIRHLISISKDNLPGAWSFWDVASNAGSQEMSKIENLARKVDPDDLAHLILTSGTTGFPKGACLSHSNMVNNAYYLGKRLTYDRENHVICCPVPLFHIFGCIVGVMSAWLHKRPLVFPSPRFDALKTLQSIEKEKCTMLYGTPTMIIHFFEEYSKHPNYDLSSLQTATCGGSPVPHQLVTVWSDKFNKPLDSLKCVYGSTEIGVVCGTLDKNRLNDQYPITPLLDHCQVKLVDSEDTIVPRESQGEVCVRSPYVFQGYWRQQEKTEEVLTKSGWFRTGDTGHMTEEGELSIVGRIKDIIIRGGENIYPTEVETLLREYPGVQEISIIGVPDPKYVEEVCAFVQLKSGVVCSEEEFKKYFKGKIAGYKIPRHVFFIDTFPLTASGKIQKFKLKETALNTLKNA